MSLLLLLKLLFFTVFGQIKKRDADLFGTVELPIPPTCRVTIWSKVSQVTEKYLSYTVTLIGIHSDDVTKLRIQRFLETGTSSSGILYYIYNKCYNKCYNNLCNICSYRTHLTIQSQDSDTPRLITIRG